MGKLETIVVLVIIIMLLFGSKKIPELARNLGKSVSEVKKGFNGESSDDSTSNSDTTTKKKSAKK